MSSGLDGTRTSSVLLDDAHIRIEHFDRGGAGGTLVVTFDPLLYLFDKPPFGHEFLRRQALDVVAVRKKTEHFYQPLSRQAFAAAVGPVAARYRRVVSYGSSLGAYAALYFGRDEPWTVVASSPRNSTHPVYGARVWQDKAAWQHERFTPAQRTRCEAVIIFDPRDAIDRRYIEAEVLPSFPGAEVMRVPFAGHPANQFLGDIGFIAPCVRAVLADHPRPVLDRRGQRRRSATYFQVLALLCLQRGHVAWADALSERAMALAPQRMLVLRTRGMVALARADCAAACGLLEAALALSAEDPLTLSLLERARRGVAGVPVPALAPVASGARSEDRLRRVWSAWRRMAKHLVRALRGNAAG